MVIIWKSTTKMSLRLPLNVPKQKQSKTRYVETYHWHVRRTSQRWRPRKWYRTTLPSSLPQPTEPGPGFTVPGPAWNSTSHTGHGAFKSRQTDQNVSHGGERRVVSSTPVGKSETESSKVQNRDKAVSLFSLVLTWWWCDCVAEFTTWA